MQRLGLVDATTFAPYDATQEVIFPPELLLQSSQPLRSVRIVGDRVTWHRLANSENLDSGLAAYVVFLVCMSVILVDMPAS